MSRESSVEVVRLTPPGRGAVATLLIEGPGAVELLRGRFFPSSGRPLESFPADQLIVGRFGPEPGEEVVVRRRPGESVEVHCHGGRAAVAMIQEALVEQGARAVAWQDWVAGHHQDPIRAAAHVALAEARTERTAAILLDQYHGALRRALAEIDEALRNRDTRRANGHIETLLGRADLGRHLTRPWRVVLTGKANVGKSSLINALMGYSRAIVHPTPGTTRDVISAGTALDGWPIELSDTAGLHTSDGVLQRAGAERARAKLADADLVVPVFDGSQPWSQADGALIETWPEGLAVHNKSDLPPAKGGRPSGLRTSAATREGVEALGRAIADRLVPDPPPPGAAVPFTERQVQCLGEFRVKAGGLRSVANRPAGD